MTKRVIVIMGGPSPEHEVSITTGISIINGLIGGKWDVYGMYWGRNREFYGARRINREIGSKEDLFQMMDLKSQIIEYVEGEGIEPLLRAVKGKERETMVFPALHGSYGEDGKLQGLLEILGVPYVGNDVAASAVAIDKVLSKDLLECHGLPQGDYRVMEKTEMNHRGKLYDKLADLLFPIYIKPARLGSSIGILRIREESDLIDGLHKAFAYDDKLVIEEEIQGREMQISVIGNHEPRVSEVGEFIQGKPFMDYHTKYTPGLLESVIPARLTKLQRQGMRRDALKAYKVLGCKGLARIDFFVAKSGEHYINEINTMPGFTPQSMTPKLWESLTGMSYRELLEQLVSYGEEAFLGKDGIGDDSKRSTVD